MPTGIRPAAAEAALMKALYDEHAPALWRYALRLTGNPSRAEDVVQETLLRAWQHPEVIGDTERPARAWLFTVARNIIIDESRTARARKEVNSLDSAPEQAGPDRVNETLGPNADRRRDGTTVRRTPRGGAPVLLPRLDHGADRHRSRHRRRHREVTAALRPAGNATDNAGNGGYKMNNPGGYTMMALLAIRTPVGFEYLTCQEMGVTR